MASPTDNKQKDYAYYAAHCLYLMTAATDPDFRSIQREMAAQWLKLAGEIGIHLNRWSDLGRLDWRARH
jgi:hypothetical protein